MALDPDASTGEEDQPLHSVTLHRGQQVPNHLAPQILRSPLDRTGHVEDRLGACNHTLDRIGIGGIAHLQEEPRLRCRRDVEPSPGHGRGRSPGDHARVPRGPRGRPCDRWHQGRSGSQRPPRSAAAPRVISLGRTHAAAPGEHGGCAYVGQLTASVRVEAEKRGTGLSLLVARLCLVGAGWRDALSQPRLCAAVVAVSTSW